MADLDLTEGEGVYNSGLAETTISKPVRAMPDYLHYQETVPNDTHVDSDAMPVGGMQGQLEVIGVVHDDVVLQDTKELTLELRFDEKEDGDFDEDIVEVYTKTASGEETIDAGTELFRYIPHTDKEMWMKARIESTDEQEDGEIDVYVRRVVQ